MTVLLSTPALDLELSGGRAVGVRTDEGVDRRRPRRLRDRPAAAARAGAAGRAHDAGDPAGDLPHRRRRRGARPAARGGAARRPDGGAAHRRARRPQGAHAWTLLGRGRLAEDIVTALQRSGIRVRDQVEVRVDRSPRDLVEEWGGSPYGVLWQGRNTVTRRLGPTTPVPGVYMAGAHATPGAGLPSVGLSAALVAQAIGPA